MLPPMLRLLERVAVPPPTDARRMSVKLTPEASLSNFDLASTPASSSKPRAIALLALLTLGAKGEVRVLQFNLHARRGQRLLFLPQQLADALVYGRVPFRLDGGAGVVVDGGLERVRGNLSLRELALRRLAVLVSVLRVACRAAGETRTMAGPSSWSRAWA
jgi:hypothetical protein